MINGEYVGIYARVEQIDGRFARSRFKAGDGNVYKEVWPVTATGGVPMRATMEAGLRSNREEDPSFDRIVRFAQGLTSNDVAGRVETLERWTDMDMTMRYVAVDRAQGNDDGAFHWYCGGGSGSGCFNHNFYWYEEPDADRLWVIPWDLDGSFNLNNPVTTIWLDWEDRTPGCGSHSRQGFNPLRVAACDKVFQAWASMQERYLDVLRTLLDGPFAQGVAEQKLDQWERQIYPHLKEEAALHEDSPIEDWNVARGQLRGAIQTLRQRAERRLERGQHQLWADPPAPNPAGQTRDTGM